MFRFPRFTDYGKTTSGLQRRAEVFSCWDYCACGEIQESEAHRQAIWRHTKIGKLTLHTEISESIFSLLIFKHVVWYWQGEFVSQSKPLWLAIISLILMILMNVSEALYFVEIGKWHFWDRKKTKHKKRFLSQARTTFSIPSFALSWKLLFIQLLLRQAQKSIIICFEKLWYLNLSIFNISSLSTVRIN